MLLCKLVSITQTYWKDSNIFRIVAFWVHTAKCFIAIDRNIFRSDFVGNALCHHIAFCLNGYLEEAGGFLNVTLYLLLKYMYVYNYLSLCNYVNVLFLDEMRSVVA